jgi:hypothetical protein
MKSEEEVLSTLNHATESNSSIKYTLKSSSTVSFNTLLFQAELSRNTVLIHAPPHAPLSSSTIFTTLTLFSATPLSVLIYAVLISPLLSVSTTTK